MTIEINATVTVARRRLSQNQLDAAIDSLEPHGGAVFRHSTGRFAATVTIPANSLVAGTITACALVGEALGAEPVSVEAMPDDEFHDHVKVEQANRLDPDLISVADAAAELDLSRQAVLKRIEAKSLPAGKIFGKYVIPRAAVESSGRRRARPKQST